MPLIPCPECHRYISTEASSCPKCGRRFRLASPATEHSSAQTAELEERYYSMLNSDNWVECRHCGVLKPWDAHECPYCDTAYSDTEIERMHWEKTRMCRENILRLKQREAVVKSTLAFIFGTLILYWMYIAGYNYLNFWFLLVTLASMMTIHASAFPGKRCKSAIVLFVLFLCTYVYMPSHIAENHDEYSDADKRFRMEIGRNFIGAEQSSFRDYYKSIDSDDGQRFKMKLPQSQKMYYGLHAEQVSIVVAGKSHANVDYQSVTFYDTNDNADMIFAKLDDVLTSNYQAYGQPSQASSGKTLIWKSDDLTFLLQKSKSDAPNHYLVTLTAKQSP